MSGLDETPAINFVQVIIKDERGWADFFITRIGLILFTSVLLLSALKVYPLFQERETQAYLGSIASDITSKIEAVDSTSMPGYRYVYSFDEKNKNVRIEISTEYVLARMNKSTGIWGEREHTHAEPVVTQVFPANRNWSNTSGFREYVKVIGDGKSGDITSPLNFSRDKARIDSMLDSVKKELARSPFLPDSGKPLVMEKVILYYTNHAQTVERDYVFVYQ